MLQQCLSRPLRGPDRVECRMRRLFEQTKRALLVLSALVATAFISQAQVTKPAPPTPIDKKKAELGGTPWNPKWDRIIEQALPQEMLSSQVQRDVRRFCPRFYNMDETDKRAFWAYFFQALAGAEAGLNPKTRAHHTEPEVAKRDEVSGTSGRTERLLQLTYADQKRYGAISIGRSTAP